MIVDLDKPRLLFLFCFFLPINKGKTGFCRFTVIFFPSKENLGVWFLAYLAIAHLLGLMLANSPPTTSVSNYNCLRNTGDAMLRSSLRG